MEWSKEIQNLCIAPMVAASFFERGGGAQRSRRAIKRYSGQRVIMILGNQKVLLQKKNKKAEKVINLFRPINPNQINYEKNYLGSNMLIGMMTSSREIPPC